MQDATPPEKQLQGATVSRTTLNDLGIEKNPGGQPEHKSYQSHDVTGRPESHDVTPPGPKADRLQDATELPKQRPGEYKRLQRVTVASYSDKNIKKVQAHRWQCMARLPQDVYKDFIGEIKGAVVYLQMEEPDRGNGRRTLHSERDIVYWTSTA